MASYEKNGYKSLTFEIDAHVMSQPYLTPERLCWLYCKSVNITLSSKYISIQSMEVWGGQYFSRTG